VFEDLYHRVLVAPWWLFFLGAGVAYFAANALFAVLYLLQPGSITGARAGSFPDAFFFSVQTMGTIGFGVYAPATTYANLMVTLESLVGLLSLAIMTGITFAKFARPTSRVMFTNKAVIGRRDGERYLMFRMANARHNTITEASLKAVLLMDIVTREGERMRTPVSLPLVRESNPFFRLSWTASHRIDEKSPFYEPGAIARLKEKNALILLTLTGLDETIAATIHARQNYGLEDIVENARFADIISVDPDTTRVIDYTKMHDVVPEAGPEKARAEGGSA